VTARTACTSASSSDRRSDAVGEDGNLKRTLAWPGAPGIESNRTVRFTPSVENQEYAACCDGKSAATLRCTGGRQSVDRPGVQIHDVDVEILHTADDVCVADAWTATYRHRVRTTDARTDRDLAAHSCADSPWRYEHDTSRGGKTTRSRHMSQPRGTRMRRDRSSARDNAQGYRAPEPVITPGL